jgi:predicted RND superfamily exporter protein
MSWAERFSRFFARRRHFFAVGIALLTAFFAWQLRHLEIYTQFLDLLPRAHPFIRNYEAYRGIYGNANTVVAAIVPREGDIYQPQVLEAIRATTDLLDSSVVDPEVNALPASHYTNPSGAIARAVHTVVSLVDGVLAHGEEVAAETGVDHNLVTSLVHRTARDSRVALDGSLHSPQLVEEIPTTKADLDALRERVRRNPSVFGPLVALDEKAALVRASFVDTRLDYGALFKHMQAAKARVESQYPVEVYLTGQPLLFGWTYAFATEILLIFGLTLTVSVLLLWAYFRRVYGVFLPMSGAACNVIWGLGFAAWVGYNLDPLVLVVPMLITARAISHSVQFVERFYEEYELLGDKDEACIRSMAELLLPCTVAIVTDWIGLLTIALATIPLMRDLGLLCSFWSGSILVTEMLLNRLMILYLPAPRERHHHVSPLAARALGAAANLVGSRPSALAIVGVFTIGSLLCVPLALSVPIGENRPGTPILWESSEYNVAAREIAGRFYGLDDLLVIAHGEIPGRVYAPDSFKYIEALQRTLETDENAGGSISLVDLQKETNRLFHNDDPRWAMWMQTTSEIAGISFLMETSVPAPGILDPYRSQDSRSLAVRVFYRDHRSSTVEDAIARLETFAENERLDGSLAIRLKPGQPGWLHRLSFGYLDPILPAVPPRLEVAQRDRQGGVTKLELDAPGARWLGPDGLLAEARPAGWREPWSLWVKPSKDLDWLERPGGAWLRDGVELRYASGSIGVLAAANDEIAASSDLSIVIVFVTTFVIVWISYRSLLIAIILTASLASASLAALAVQAMIGIAIDVNTLPVQAIGVGLGVDYALYLVDRVMQERPNFATRVAAVQHSIRTTGLAIGFTASTLLVGIVFWIPISSLRFSSEMSLLLSILMGVNALGAILFVPAVICLLPDRFAGKLR